MDCEKRFVCKFEENDNIINQYLKVLLPIKMVKFGSAVFMPLSLALIIYTLFAYNDGSMGLFTFIFAVVLFAAVCFGYYGEAALVKRLIKSNDKKRFGNKVLTNIVSFTDEEIVVECEKDRAVLPYSSIKKQLNAKIFTPLCFQETAVHFLRKTAVKMLRIVS